MNDLIVKIGGQPYTLRIERGVVEGRMRIDFRYNERLKNELKASLRKAKFDWDTKQWWFDDCERNDFVLEFMGGGNPYSTYDLPLVDFRPTRGLYNHQVQIAQHVLTRRCCIVAAEMGTGKTLSAIEVMEEAQRRWGTNRWWYVAPKSALESVKYELSKWRAKVLPQLMTYEQMVRTLTGWYVGLQPPQGVIFDESSRLKSPKAQRSLAAMHLAENIRGYYKQEAFVVLMSGSPAPKSPLDWWMQCEIARPGFLREGSWESFRDRLALVKQVENMGGIAYPKLITFRDSIEKCEHCGKHQTHEIHKTDTFSQMTFVPGNRGADEVIHEFSPMKDEVGLFHKRVEGLSVSIFKKDCLDLPEKVYRIEERKPTAYMTKLAKTVKKSSPSVAEALIKMRALSDGFQYYEKLKGHETCTYCNGTKVWPLQKMVLEAVYDEFGLVADAVYEPGTDVCIHCSGEGRRKVFETIAVEVETPKEEMLTDILEQKEEDGRIIVYAGFTASIDKIAAIAKKAGWEYIRVDGRGWTSSFGVTDPQKLIRIFQEDRETYPRIVFDGHPGSAGMGLTLTASDTIVYYSNDFNGESRIQSESRIHRPGSRGANIIDLVHLPVDRLVIDNLKSKKDLMKITMGDLEKLEE